MHWRELNVWKKSYQLVLEVYKAVSEFPKSEKYGIADQLKRASVSIHPRQHRRGAIPQHNQGIPSVPIQCPRLAGRGTVFSASFQRSEFFLDRKIQPFGNELPNHQQNAKQPDKIIENKNPISSQPPILKALLREF